MSLELSARWQNQTQAGSSSTTKTESRPKPPPKKVKSQSELGKSPNGPKWDPNKVMPTGGASNN